jgi:DNA-binding response OmpR family regulator
MAPSASTTILLVEDHLLTRRFLADNLAADGYEPLEASTVEHARRLIRGGGPALAVLDLELADGDGLDLISELRDPDVGLDRHLPVLVLSGRGTEIDRIRGLTRGADDYLVKPSWSLFETEGRSILRRMTATGSPLSIIAESRRKGTSTPPVIADPDSRIAAADSSHRCPSWR